MGGSEHHGVFRMSDLLAGVPLAHLAEVCVVSKVSPMLDAGTGVLGAINLRQTLVPLLDVPRCLGLPARTTPPATAAILRHGGRLAAMALDEILALATAAPTALGRAPAGEGDPAAAIPRAFLHGGELVSCLDVPAFFEKPGGITAPAAGPVASDDGAGRAAKLLIVSCGGASFAVDAIGVHATVPKRAIDTSEVSTEFCLGFVQHQGWKVPVVDAATVLGLGVPATRTNAPIVILRFADGALLALAVDTMERIAHVPASRIHQSSAVVRSAGLLKDAFVAEDGQQTHILDIDAMGAVPEFAELAQLTMREGAAAVGPATAKAGAGAQAESQRYLLFRAGRTQAALTGQIARILDAPERLVAVNLPGHPEVEGLFEVDNRSVPLIRLGTASEPPRFVLLVGAPGQQVGFGVDRIHGVQTSNWRATDETPQGKQDLVELRDGATTQLVAVVDLVRMAAGINGSASPEAR